MHCGNITYYKSIPTNPGNNSTLDEQFWKQYIDYVLISQSNSGSRGVTGYGNYLSFGSVQINSPPSSTSPPTDTQYMNYQDNPLRPNVQFWFGPLSFCDFLGNETYWVTRTSNRNWLPGNVHESPLYSAKIGVAAALGQMQSNQPNDAMTLIYYSAPQTSTGTTGCFNCVRAPLGINYNYAISSLWYPQTTLNPDGTTNTSYSETGSSLGEINCQLGNSADTTMMLDVPHSKFGTCFAMGLMLAYNQYVCTDPNDNTLRKYVTSTQYPAGMAGGMGRIGAQKVVIFETDGIVNTPASASLISKPAVGNTPAYKYYQIRYDPANPGTSEFPGSNGNSPDYNAYAVLDQMKTDLGTTRKPFRLYALGFGPIFEAGSPDRTRGLSILAQMQSNGTPTATATPIPLATNQIIVGTDDQMAVLLQAALTTIMQGALQCALVQ
jgi:hypothetical protein